MKRSTRGQTEKANAKPVDRNGGQPELELGDRQKAVIDIVVDMAIRRLLKEGKVHGSTRDDEQVR